MFTPFRVILSIISVTSHCNDNSVIIHFVTFCTPFCKLSSAPSIRKKTHPQPDANAATDGRRPSFLLALPNHPIEGLAWLICMPTQMAGQTIFG
jgi:hypothetical protein